MIFQRCLLGLCILTFPLLGWADLGIDSVRASFAKGKPSSLKGGRFSLGWDWSKPLLTRQSWQLGGYWDLSGAYYRVKPDCHQCKQLWTIAFAPIFRFQYLSFEQVTPYLEASVGLAGLSSTKLGNRLLGAHWAFQDLLGAGVQFGSKKQYDLSYHYLHYSNANIVKPNNGIDVKFLLSFSYHFNP